jgi:hypothetical protein
VAGSAGRSCLWILTAIGSQPSEARVEVAPEDASVDAILAHWK